MIGERLVAAYRSTRYTVVDADGHVVAEARIGELAPDVDALLDSHGATSGAFITAWNPRSEPTSASVNAAAPVRLVAHLERLGLAALPHIGVGDDEAWPPEHGLFVIGLTEADAVDLAVSYGQNAIVIVDRGSAARLVVTPPMRS